VIHPTSISRNASRPGPSDDSYTFFLLARKTLADPNRRLGSNAPTGGAGPARPAHLWQERCSLGRHLPRTAEGPSSAEPDARVIQATPSIVHDGIHGLTEFLALPGQPSAREGRELLARAENRAAARGRGELGFRVPMAKRGAAVHLLGRACRLGSSVSALMSDAPRSRCEGHVLPSPLWVV
jgi:hypothetical protein